MAEPFIHNHSALWLTGSFVGFLVERFSLSNRMPWVAFNDINKLNHFYTDAEMSDGAPAVGDALYVTTCYDEATEAEDLYPRIVVDAGQDIGGNHNVLGDLDADQKGTFDIGGRGQWQLSELDMSFHIFAELKGEARYLAELSANAVRMTRRAICRNFTLRDLKPVVVQKPRPDRQGKWTCDVDFRLFKEDRWYVAPYGKRIDRINTDLNMANIRLIAGEEVRKLRQRRE